MTAAPGDTTVISSTFTLSALLLKSAANLHQSAETITTLKKRKTHLSHEVNLHFQIPTVKEKKVLDPDMVTLHVFYKEH